MNRTIVIVSGFLDATVQEYQPDTTFKMFKSLAQLDEYLQTGAIRATAAYVTSDVIVAANASLSHMIELMCRNQFFKADTIQYLAEAGEENTRALRFLIAENGIDNIYVVECKLNRAYVTNYINGTIDVELNDVRRKAVYRIPRSEYIKQNLRNNPTLDDAYVSDEEQLKDIPDIPVPEQKIIYSASTSKKIKIAGHSRRERTAFALLVAQYYALNHKTLIIESDVDYHTLTEYVTKSSIESQCPYLMVTVTDLYKNITAALDRIKSFSGNLIVIGCVKREPYSYNYLMNLLYYLLSDVIEYFVIEAEMNELSPNEKFTLVVPDTVIGCLQSVEKFDQSLLDSCNFVAVNMQDMPDLHIANGTVVSTILNDLLSTNSIVCQVVTITSLRLATSAYDLGALL